MNEINNYGLNPQAYRTPNIAELEQKIQQLKQMDQMQVNVGVSMPQQKYSANNTKSIFIQIGEELDNLTETQRNNLLTNPQYVELDKELQGLIQSAFIDLIMPHVEESKNGNELLTEQLNFIKANKRAVINETNKNIELLEEFQTKYANMTWNEFLEMKKENK